MTIIAIISTLKMTGVATSARLILPSCLMADLKTRLDTKEKIVRIMEICGTMIPVLPKA